jgi:hypothetical protein
MRFTCHVVGLSLLAVALGGGVASARPAPPRVWMTTGDKTNLLAEQPASALGAPVAGAPTVTVDPSARYRS